MLDLGVPGDGRDLIMLGVLLLLIGPVLRVGFAAIGFIVERDRLYTAVRLLVLAALAFSFLW